MAYQHIPDHLKKKKGRTRKYHNGYTEYKRKPYVPKDKNRQQTAEELRGVPVVLLDYVTGEYVGEYPSYSACADDLEIPLTSIVGSFSRKSGECCISRIPKHELLLMKKSAFEAMRGSIPND